MQREKERDIEGACSSKWKIDDEKTAMVGWAISQSFHRLGYSLFSRLS